MQLFFEKYRPAFVVLLRFAVRAQPQIRLMTRPPTRPSITEWEVHIAAQEMTYTVSSGTLNSTKLIP